MSLRPQLQYKIKINCKVAALRDKAPAARQTQHLTAVATLASLRTCLHLTRLRINLPLLARPDDVYLGTWLATMQRLSLSRSVRGTLKYGCGSGWLTQKKIRHLHFRSPVSRKCYLRLLHLQLHQTPTEAPVYRGRYRFLFR